MKWLSIFSLCLAFTSQLKAQFILAGQHNATDYFHDVVPDTVITGPGFSVDTIPMDLNNDFINDFEFRVRWAASPGGSDHKCYMKMLNNNEGALSHFDSCFAFNGNYLGGVYAGHPFHDGDSINENTIWSNQDLYMARSNSSVISNYCVFNNFCDTDTCYAGVRIFTPNDTLYGWIKLTHVYYYGFTLLEYACNTDSTIGINELGKNIFATVYPNPFTAQLNISLAGNESSQLILYDIVSRKLLQQAFVNSVSINTTQLERGIYFYEVRSGNKTVGSGKVVKE